MEVLHTLHMDLCSPMRVQSINGKKYILVIVVSLNKTVRYIRTDNGTEFVNQVMSKYYEDASDDEEAIKRVFRYLKGTINMGLWYPKDNAMSLIAYADVDHAGCQDSRRSTLGSAQFLRDRLVSWSSKKQRST
ncbi:uncharacterized mitochondrial protein-like protein, partial [Tanacetum coccineum]